MASKRASAVSGLRAARRANVTDVSPEDLTKAILHSESVFKRVKQTHEATLDSRYLILTAETAAAKARTMRIDKNAFDMDDFVIRLKRFLGRRGVVAAAISEDEAEAEDADEGDVGDKEKAARKAEAWGRMGRLALKYNHRIPTCEFMWVSSIYRLHTLKLG